MSGREDVKKKQTSLKKPTYSETFAQRQYHSPQIAQAIKNNPNRLN